MCPHYTIRPAQAGDLDSLLEMYLALQDHVESSNPDLWRMTAPARRQLRTQLKARLNAPDSWALVAEDDQADVVGMIFGRIVINRRYTPRRAAIIDQAFVSPAHRCRGIGVQLVAELCQILAAHGVDDVSLRYAFGNEEATAFWTALGFTPRIVTVGADPRLLPGAAQMRKR